MCDLQNARTVWFDDDVGEMNLQAGSELKCCEADQVVRVMLLVLLGQLSFFLLKWLVVAIIFTQSINCLPFELKDVFRTGPKPVDILRILLG